MPKLVRNRAKASAPQQTGAKSWVQRITIRGKRTEMGLGSASLVTLAEARAAALENHRMARADGDPLQARRASVALPTFEEAARKVHALHLPTWKNKKHGAQFISTLETYAFPTIGQRKVSEVTSADVLTILTPIWTTKAETARRVRQRIGTVMKWCIAQGWRLDNPAENITQALPKVDVEPEHFASLPYDRVSECIAAVRASEAMVSTKLCFEFGVLTCARSTQLRKAAWEQIDMDAAIWSIPSEGMKGNRPHRVPLSPRALAILAEAKALGDGTGLIFPGAKAGAPLSDGTLRKLIRERGFEVDIHGFRTSFRTWSQEKTNFPREVLEAAMSHAVGDAVERAYARSDVLERRREVMNAWASFLEGAGAKVVQLRA